MKKLLLILSLLMIMPSQAALLGRLFTTPAERSNLDSLRQTKKVSLKIEKSNNVVLEEQAPIELPKSINLQGYVKRNDGKQGTIWVNNEALPEGSSSKDIQVGLIPEKSNRIPIRLPANGKKLTLKAGQVYDPERNKVREARSHAAQGDETSNGRISDDEN